MAFVGGSLQGDRRGMPLEALPQGLRSGTGGQAVVVRTAVGLGCQTQAAGDSTMTVVRMDLMALLEKGADAEFLREMIEVISNRLMAMEVEGLSGDG